DALGSDQDVWLHVPVVNGEPFPRASPSGHHFIGDHEHAVPVADFAQAGKVLRRRNEHPVGANDGFNNDGRYVTLVTDHVFDVIGACHVAAGIGVLDRTVVTIGLRRKDETVGFASRLHGPAAGVGGGGGGPGRRGVVGGGAGEGF